MSASDNTSPRVECRDCAFCEGANWRGGTCTNTGSGYTSQFVHAEWSCRLGVLAHPAEPTSNLVENPAVEQGQTLFGLPVVERDDMPEIAPGAIKFGPPLIEQAVKPGLLDALKQQIKDSFSGEELRQSPIKFAEYMQRIDPSGDTLGGYIVPHEYQRAMPEALAKGPVRREVSRNYLFGHDAKMSIGYRDVEGGELKWHELPGAGNFSMGFDPAASEGDGTVHITWETVPYYQAFEVPPDVDEETLARMKQHVMERINDDMKLYGQSLVELSFEETKPLTWQSVMDVIQSLRPSRERRRDVQGYWPYEGVLVELDHIDEQREYFDFGTALDGPTRVRGLHSIQKTGHWMVDRNDWAFGKLADAFRHNDTVRVSRFGRVYKARVSGFTFAEMVVDRSAPSRERFHVTFDLLEEEPRYVPYTKENPGP